MGITLTPLQLRALLKETIPAGHPVLISGMPGIGKTSVVDQVVDEIAADMILSHPSVHDPTNYIGYPTVSDDRKSATFVPFGDFLQAIKAKKRTVWFFDDMGQAPVSVQQACMQLFLARQVNGHKISKYITFIAATNRRTDRAGVSGILEPVKSRFHTIVELVPDATESAAYAIDQNWAPEIIAFWRFRPELFAAFQPTADLTNSPVPRTWEHVNDLLKLTLPKPILVAAIQGAIGEGAGIEFIAFLDMYRSLPSIDNVL